MDLETFWFCLIVVVWAMYFLLEGFDFGVGMLLPVVPRTDEERERGLADDRTGVGRKRGLARRGRRCDLRGLPGLVRDDVLGLLPRAPAHPRAPHRACLLVRVALEKRDTRLAVDVDLGEHDRQRRCVAALGIGLSSLVYGTPIDSDGDFTGNLLDLFSPYSVLAGVAVVALFALHGATFLTLRTGVSCATVPRPSPAGSQSQPWCWARPTSPGPSRSRWTATTRMPSAAIPAHPHARAALAVVFLFAEQDGFAFVMTALGTISLVATLFVSLYPRVMVSSTDFENSLTVDNAASSHYALQVMSVVALIFVPLVLLYQGWTYYVFRHRIGGEREASV